MEAELFRDMSDVQKARFLDVRLIVEAALDDLENGSYGTAMDQAESRIVEFVKANVFEVTLENHYTS